MSRQYVPESNPLRLEAEDFRLAGAALRNYAEGKNYNTKAGIPLFGIGRSGYCEAELLQDGARHYLLLRRPFLMEQTDSNMRETTIAERREARRQVKGSPFIIVYDNTVKSGQSIFSGLEALTDLDLSDDQEVLVVVGKDFFERPDLQTGNGWLRGRVANLALRTTEERQFYGPKNAMERIHNLEEEKRANGEALGVYPIDETIGHLKKYGVWNRLCDEEIQLPEQDSQMENKKIQPQPYPTSRRPGGAVTAGMRGFLIRRVV